MHHFFLPPPPWPPLVPALGAGIPLAEPPGWLGIPSAGPPGIPAAGPPGILPAGPLGLLGILLVETQGLRWCPPYMVQDCM